MPGSRTAKARSARGLPTDATKARNFGKALASAREGRGMSQGMLADLLGKSQGGIGMWETGASVPATPEDLFEVEEALELDPGSLSRHLGYVPATLAGNPRVGRGRADVVAAITSDPRLTTSNRRVLVNVYQEFVNETERRSSNTSTARRKSA